MLGQKGSPRFPFVDAVGVKIFYIKGRGIFGIPLGLDPCIGRGALNACNGLEELAVTPSLGS